MFPIRDTIRSYSFPIINWLILITNTVVFLFELSLSPLGLERFIRVFGLVPARLSLLNPFSFLPFLTHMFLHGGWFHFLSNMWMLFIFGDNVEDRMGSLRYLIFYLLGGIAAGFLQAFVNLGSTVPAIGASGAIAAVMGAYFLYFPRAKVITFVPLFFLPWFIDIPAIFFLGFWFVSQLYSGFLSLVTISGAAIGGVAWWAHIGGFLFGLFVAVPFGYRRRRRQYFDEYFPW